MFERTRLVFESGGIACAAYLFRPEQTSPGSVPCVVVGHGASGTTANLFPVAERFAAAGIAALVFDYRYFGESGGRPHQLMDTQRQREDWQAAVRLARSCDWRGRAKVSTRNVSHCGVYRSVAAT
jgi:dienelactone hydrolase